MRRAASIILFIIGGFCVGMQVMVAFAANSPGGGPVPELIRFAGFAALFLAPATWLSPGDRWRELGLTILIGAAVCAGSFAVALTVPDEQGVVADITPLNPYLDTTQGFLNLGLVALIGVWLYFSRYWRDQ